MPHCIPPKPTLGGRAGHVQSDDGLLSLDLAMPKELGGKGGATNPEQLFAAGYAACFESAMRFIAGKQKLPLQDASVTATVSLHTNARVALCSASRSRPKRKVLIRRRRKRLYRRRTRFAPIPTPSRAISRWRFR